MTPLRPTATFITKSVNHNGYFRRTARFVSEDRGSVNGIVYAGDSDAPVIRLFTKKGCTLCDKVKDVLIGLREEFPHTLESVDITTHPQWFAKYKYDIPVLHVGEKFWIKHRISLEEAREGLKEARDGDFKARPGDPNAAAMERQRAN